MCWFLVSRSAECTSGSHWLTNCPLVQRTKIELFCRSSASYTSGPPACFRLASRFSNPTQHCAPLKVAFHRLADYLWPQMSGWCRAVAVGERGTFRPRRARCGRPSRPGLTPALTVGVSEDILFRSSFEHIRNEVGGPETNMVVIDRLRKLTNGAVYQPHYKNTFPVYSRPSSHEE